jgi:multidrug resistance protein
MSVCQVLDHSALESKSQMAVAPTLNLEITCNCAREPSKSAMPTSIAQESNSISNPPYTSFNKNELKLLTLLVGCAAITSPLTSTIYLPLLPTIMTDFKISSQEVNMTLTIYIIFQALSPAIFGPLSDHIGRRPVYLTTIAIYAAANLGMALQKYNYSTLMLFRAFQSLGASAAFAISYGIVADVCVPSERGKMMGGVSMALNLGTCIGPILGGLVAYLSKDIQWIFWTLLIVGIILFLLVGMFLPETARTLVGNGSDRDGLYLWQQSWWVVIRRCFNSFKGKKDEAMFDRGRSPVLVKLKLQHFIGPLRVIFYADTFLCLWLHGSFYAVDYTMVAEVPSIYKNDYNFNEIMIGLAYLPRGFGIICGSFCNGKVMDYNYRLIAKRNNWTIRTVSGDDLTHFPIELARTRGTFALLVISTATLVGYGWTVNQHGHFAILLTLQFIQGFWGTCMYTIYNTLLIDSFPRSPSTAAAAASIVRCAMAAVATSILNPLLNAAGSGWYFTALGIWSGVCGFVAVWLLRRHGSRWRQLRSEA